VALITVSVAAQITTFPITSYYFGQFPSYFWITNLFIIPLTGFLTPVGILLLFVYKIPVVASAIAFILNNTLKLSLYLLTAIENLPFSVLPVTISQVQLFLLIIIVFFFLLLLVKIRALTIKVIILLVILINLSFISSEIIRQRTSQIIVYDHPGKATLHLISGKTNYLITEADFQNDATIRNSVNSTLRKLGTKPPVVLSPDDNFADENMLIKDRKIVFKNHIIVFGTDSDPPLKNTEHLIYLNPPGNITGKKVTGLLTIIYTGRKKFFGENIQSEIYFTSINGAYRKIW
jgi:competence protein ComEC